MNRIDRLSALLIMLQSSSGIALSQITSRFGVGLRTVYRDIKALEEAGVPIVGDSRVGYSIMDGYKLPPLMFTQNEAFAFLAAEQLVNKFTDKELSNNYKVGVEKIRAVLRLSQKESVSFVEKTIGNLDFNDPNYIDSDNKLQLILRSIDKQEMIKIQYKSYSKNELTDRCIVPIGLFFSMVNWYLAAFCNTRNDYRIFKIKRIASIELTEVRFDSNKYLSLNELLDSMKDKSDLQKVIISVRYDSLPIISAGKYYQGLISEDIEGDFVKMTFMYPSLQKFARWYLSYIDIAEIVYPQQLKDIVKEYISKSSFFLN